MAAPFLTEPHLVLAWGTVRHASFPDRVAAAAGAGYASIGLSIGAYQVLRDSGWTDRDLSAVLDGHGVGLDEIEVIFGFAGPPGPAGLADRPGLVYADPEVEQTAFHLADVFGARRVQAVGRLAPGRPGPEVAAAFGALCDRAAPHGLDVALEFVPYSDIPDAAAAAQVVAAAGRANGGVCVDSWHLFRAGADPSDLAVLDIANVLMVQLNDGPAGTAGPDRMAEAVHGRKCPGEGSFDIDAFLAQLDRPGAAPVVSVEVYSDELDLLEPAEAACRAAAATRAVLARAAARSEARPPA
ncbi:sugar phosphate isomerase/epimerase [Pseudonocardia petroleophila]|uniref:Sugar phosphate isomerase/epimerase n=1 Tax=Pseudonocardia petroleophila TaxID=37331 RepID=A0A7G7MCI3_9PSEU|nr:sugar phosphate isomerase/epimerase [Pseudonocardia petroleophila]QNG50494.1 sugar phosphate isomerase/epimerase [Pseudonocardia petroleophila]